MKSLERLDCSLVRGISGDPGLVTGSLGEDRFTQGSLLLMLQACLGGTMRRLTGSMLMVAALSGCVTTEGGTGRYRSRIDTGDGSMIEGASNRTYAVPTVPGVMGPNGAPVAMAAPYNATPPAGAAAARAMLASSQPLDVLQQVKYNDGNTAGVMPMGALKPPGGISPLGVPGAPGMPGMAPPPSAFLAGQRGGPIRRVNGEHPGHNPMAYPPGVVAAAGAPMGGPVMPQGAGRTQIVFSDPAGMKVSWFAPGKDGAPGFTAQGLDTPGKYNFLQGAIYRLKLSNVPNRPDMNLYPTLEVLPGTPKAAAFLAHSTVPVSFTEEDFQQIAAGHFVVKVIYLPDAQYQDLAGPGGPDEIVSSRLEPGVDPIAEASKRGSILVVVRLGKIDLELANSPSMDAPPPGMPMMMAPNGGMPGGPACGPDGRPLPPLPGGPGQMMPPPPSNLPPGVMMPPPGQPRPMPMVPGGPVPGQNLPPAAPKPTGEVNVGSAAKAEIDSLVNSATNSRRSGQ